MERLERVRRSLPLLAWGLAAMALLLLGLPVMPLYQRLQRDAALDNPVRARLYEVVARNPGITIQDAAEKVGIARTTASYHLRILGREGLVVERPARKSVHYYRNDGRLSDEDQMRLQALASDRTRHVATLLLARPGLQRSELARALNLSIATVNWHLRPLSEHGLVREEARGRRRHLFGTTALDMCMRLREGQPELLGGTSPAAYPAPGINLPPAEGHAHAAEDPSDHAHGAGSPM